MSDRTFHTQDPQILGAVVTCAPLKVYKHWGRFRTIAIYVTARRLKVEEVGGGGGGGKCWFLRVFFSKFFFFFFFFPFFFKKNTQRKKLIKKNFFPSFLFF